MNHKWTGMTQKNLENHIDCHRFSFVRMIEATNYVSHQIPKECTRLVNLVGSTDSKDYDVLSALAEIRQDDTRMRKNFELAAIFISPTCMVAKKQGNKKVEFYTTISATDGK